MCILCHAVFFLSVGLLLILFSLHNSPIALSVDEAD